jgi:hypothetical protein
MPRMNNKDKLIINIAVFLLAIGFQTLQNFDKLFLINTETTLKIFSKLY